MRYLRLVNNEAWPKRCGRLRSAFTGGRWLLSIAQFLSGQLSSRLRFKLADTALSG